MQIKKVKLLLVLIIIAQSLFCMGMTDNNPNVPSKEKNEIAYIDSTSSITDSIAQLSDEIFDDIFSEKFDSLMNDWYIRNAYNIDSSSKNLTPNQASLLCGDYAPESLTMNIPDSVYIQRLSSINSLIDLTYNESVRKMIEFYSFKIKNKTEIILGLANYYFPRFEETLDKYQLPLELKYMAVIESALNAKIVSRVGATGLWQFMYGTGKNYGLEVNSYVDERRDPIKATEAAARYLSDLYNIYKDWHLVIAAYNCGPGNINKAIARSGGKRDYWSVYYRLPRETRGYVPAFISVAYVMNYYKYHNLTPRTPSFLYATDTIHVNKYLHFKQIASGLNIELGLLRELNPMYKKDIIPAKEDKTYPLVLPVELISKFLENENEIFANERDTYFPNNKIREPENVSASNSGYVPNIKGKTKIYYTVKSGDVLGQIADWFNVKVIDLRYWNNLRGNMIRVEQKLTIYVPNESADDFRDLETMNFEQKQRFIGKTKVSNIIPEEETDGEYVIYTVKNGDNLWDIAKQYPGISADEIKHLNNISNTRGLYIGQKLKIMKKS